MIEHIKTVLETNGFSLQSIAQIPGGRIHDNFLVTPIDGPSLIARFMKPDAKDWYFNGPVSLEREKNLMGLIRNQANLPAPNVHGLYQTEDGPFSLVEKLPGILWSEYIKNNPSADAYLKSLNFLGKDIAHLHHTTFNSFGDVMAEGVVQPEGVNNFAQRVTQVTDFNLDKAAESGTFKPKELDQVSRLLKSETDNLEDELSSTKHKPILIMTDLHPDNFLVELNGQPSGYFDLGTCQAGLPSLEIFELRITMFNYLEGFSDRAEQAFLKGYSDAGGNYDPSDLVNKKLEYVLSIGHLLTAVSAYRSVRDGTRDSWSDSFKDIVMDAVTTGSINYEAIAQILKPRT